VQLHSKSHTGLPKVHYLQVNRDQRCELMGEVEKNAKRIKKIVLDLDI
jgi:hypothetical protein